MLQRVYSKIGVTQAPKSHGWKWALAGIVLAASIARGWLLFSTPLVPGMNGGYYLVQARAVLTRGTLGVPDLPLTFYAQAALARIIQILSHRDLEWCILLAVKLADSILPALVACPVFLLVRRWVKSANGPEWIAVAAAGFAVLNAPFLSMAGDFEKNSLGLLWLAALLFSIDVWLGNPSRRNAIAVVGFWGLAGITHIGVFGAALLFGGLAILFHFIANRGRGWKVLWPMAIAAGVACGLAAVVVLWKFDPHRIHRLVNALSHPGEFLGADNMHGPPAGKWGNDSKGAANPFPLPGAGPGNGGHPGPGFGRNWAPPVLFGTVALAALATCWRRRHSLLNCETCVAAACAAGTLVMTGPWVQGDKQMRFDLIAMLPAVLAATFALLHLRNRWLGGTVVALALIVLCGTSYECLRRGGQPVVSEVAVSELRSLAPLIPNPDQTLIVARHGLEWWTAWTLHTHIAQSSGVAGSDWQKFRSVLFLESKRGGFPMPPGNGPHANTERGIMGTISGFFDGRPPGPGPMPPGGPPGPGGPMGDPQIPKDAETIHDGEDFKLARVLTPPAFVAEQPASQWDGVVH